MAVVLPMIWEIIELDLLKNLALSSKYKVQDANFSEKQYSLHYSLAEPSENKYVYYLSDDTNHDPPC